ncbi:MAG: N-acetylmuramoyl-L-alanine amidase [Lachnospiraceae bacterium]|nr:N-acetylmuramoyl-L-alanine amidase [Lachnospiraceae bacterium]
MKRKKILKTVISLALAAAIAFAGPGEAFAASYDINIMLDAGHGGSDSGAKYDGIEEKEINLKIAQFLKTYLSDYVGVNVMLTREDDTSLTLEERVNIASEEGADVLISLHNNAASSDADGATVYYQNDSLYPEVSEIGEGLSEQILKRLTQVGLTDNGIRIRNSENGSTYEDGSPSDYYGILRHAKIAELPAIIVEHAFLSNEDDRDIYLSDDAGLQALAMADAMGIADYYGLQYIGITDPVTTLMARNSNTLRVEWDEQEMADGYIVYRSTTKKGTYTRIGKVTDDNYFDDKTCTVGQEYYYKVRAYRRFNGATLFSEYSKIRHGHTIGGATLNRLYQNPNGYMRLTWSKVPGATGYAIYRSDEGEDYELVTIVEDPDKTAYNDHSIEGGTSCAYKIRPMITLYDNEGFGKGSNVIEATFVEQPEISRHVLNESGKVKLVWNRIDGASKVVLERANNIDGEFKTIATITDSTRVFTDNTSEPGLTYAYRLKAYNDQSKVVTGSTDYSDEYEVYASEDIEIEAIRMNKAGTGVYMRWNEIPGAYGYRIYRSESPNGGFMKLKDLIGQSVVSYTDKDIDDLDDEAYYKVKAFFNTSKGVIGGYASDYATANIETLTRIMGKSRSNPEQMARFFLQSHEYPADDLDYLGAATILEFAEIVYEEAEAEGVRAEVVFAQMCKETGYLQFGGDVSIEQCNFAGIGATGGGAAGAEFDDVRTGIRAQVQHLKAYASDEPLNGECVDPRFQYVQRESAIYVEWLGKNENPTGAGWATGFNYGYSMVENFLRPLLEA